MFKSQTELSTGSNERMLAPRILVFIRVSAIFLASKYLLVLHAKKSKTSYCVGCLERSGMKSFKMFSNQKLC